MNAYKDCIVLYLFNSIILRFHHRCCKNNITNTNAETDDPLKKSLILNSNEPNCSLNKNALSNSTCDTTNDPVKEVFEICVDYLKL